MARLAGGEPLSLEYLIRSAPTALPSSLRNAAETFGHLVTLRTPPSPTNDEFVGMTEYVMEFKSIHEEEAIPMNDLDDEVEGDIGAPPRLRMEQLKA